MKKDQLKFFSLFILFIFACFVSWSYYFRSNWQKEKINIHLFPKVIGEWTSEDLPITDVEYEILETRNAFARKYTSVAKEAVYLYIVYSERNRRVSHPPEICYVGSGVSVIKSDRDAVVDLGHNLTINVNKLFLERDDNQQIAYYWFKVGKSFTTSYWKQQLLIVIKSLLNEPASSALIRISVPVNNGNIVRADQTIKNFSRVIIPFFFSYLP